MDETRVISVEDPAMQDSNDVDELGKAITGMRKSIQDFKKSSDAGFSLMKEQFAILINSLSTTTNSCEIPATNLGILGPRKSQRYETALKSPKMDFLSNYCDNPYTWLQKCERYFQYHSIKYEEWVDLAEFHLDDRAKIWYTSWKLDKQFITWSLFCNELCRWFDNQHYNVVVDEASNVEQPQDSIEKFGACKVLDKMPNRIPEESTPIIDVSSAQIDLPYEETHNLFDDLTEPILASSRDVYDDNSTKEGFSNMVDTKALNSVKVAIGLNDQETEAVKVLEDLIQPIQPGLESFHGKSYFICIEKVEQSSLKMNEAMEYYFPAVPFQFYEQEDGIQSNDALNSLGITIGKMMMFTFDPGGSSRLDKGCAAFSKLSDAFHFSNDRQHHDPSFAIMAGSVGAFFIFRRVMIIVLLSFSIGTDSWTVVEVMVVYFGRFLLSITTYECVLDIVTAVHAIKVAKSLNESTVTGHYLLLSEPLTECYKKMNLRYHFPAIQMN